LIASPCKRPAPDEAAPSPENYPKWQRILLKRKATECCIPSKPVRSSSISDGNSFDHLDGISDGACMALRGAQEWRNKMRKAQGYKSK
jgi:hypothetical protein